MADRSTDRAAGTKAKGDGPPGYRGLAVRTRRFRILSKFSL